MNVETIAGWVAPAATMCAATMTALNLGARVTGWGFVVFTVASAAWCAVALATSQDNLLWSNAFLLVVNVVGVWRWLGRKARHERAGLAAAAESAGDAIPTLTPLTRLPGMPVTNDRGEKVGVVVDAMMRCDDLRPSYLVVSDGGIAGVAERLYAVGRHEIRVSLEEVAWRSHDADLTGREPLPTEAWPTRFRRD